MYRELAKLYYHTEKDEKALEVLDRYINFASKYNRDYSGVKKLRKRLATEDFRRLVNKCSYDQDTNKTKNTPTNKKTSPVKKEGINKIDEKIDFPDWYISLSFGHSTSKNYNKAFTLAKHAQKYIEEYDDSDNVIHQAIYSEEPNEYLAFIKLYDLVKNWKSSFVIINGDLMDSKIIGKINYCYSDKCRSGDSSFYYGASAATKNPFGCHRLQISAYNNPWWSFGQFDTNGIWHVDKDSILQRIKDHYRPFKKCPAFSLAEIKNNLEKLPNKINPKNNPDWVASDDSIVPKERSEPTHTIKLEFDIDDKTKSKIKKEQITKSENEGNGCVGCLTLVIIIVIIGIIF